MKHQTIITECESLGLKVKQVPAEGRRSYSAQSEFDKCCIVYWSTSYEGGLLGLPRIVTKAGTDHHARSLKEIRYLVKA